MKGFLNAGLLRAFKCWSARGTLLCEVERQISCIVAQDFLLKVYLGPWMLSSEVVLSPLGRCCLFWWLLQQASYDLALGIPRRHFCHILLVRASHQGLLLGFTGWEVASLTYQPPPGFPNSTFETQTQKEWSEGCFLASFMSFLNTSSSSLPANCTPTPSSWRERHYFCLPTLFSPFFYKQIPLSWGDTQILRSCQL